MASSSNKKQIFNSTKDRDVITSAAPGVKVMGYKCGNPECYVRETEVPLKACATCKSMRSVADKFIKFHCGQLIGFHHLGTQVLFP